MVTIKEVAKEAGVAVGTVSNMYDISEKLIGAGKIIKP